MKLFYIHYISVLAFIKFDLFLLEIGRVDALKNLQIHMPRAIMTGDAVTLSCTYDLEGADLYSIRWYRDEFEFYRFVPKESPPTMVFPLPSTEIDLSESDEFKVRILGLHKQLTGEYQCEVSADAPVFHTDIKIGFIYIVDYTENEPVLTADRTSYSVGETIKANCSTPPSYPAANVSWYINDHKISNVKMMTLPEDSDTWDPESSHSFIEIITEPETSLTYQVGGNILQTSSSQLPLNQAKGNAYKLDYVLEELNSGGNLYAIGGQKIYDTTEADPNLAHTTVVRIHFPIASDKDLNLSCEASIFDIYKIKSPHMRIKENSPQIASAATDSQSSGSNFAKNCLLTITSVAVIFFSNFEE